MDQGLEPSEGGRARGFPRTGLKRQRERTPHAAEKEHHREKKGEPPESLMEWTSSHGLSSNLTKTRPIQSFPDANRRTTTLCGTIAHVNSGIRGRITRTSGLGSAKVRRPCHNLAIDHGTGRGVARRLVAAHSVRIPAEGAVVPGFAIRWPLVDFRPGRHAVASGVGADQLEDQRACLRMNVS